MSRQTGRSKSRPWRRFINWNIKLSEAFDSKFIKNTWRNDGLKEYVYKIVPEYLSTGQCIYDIGGGKRPYVGTQVPRKKGMKVIGVDISQEEMDKAPKGSYDKTIRGDIGSNRLKPVTPKADLIICEAVMEHVKNTKQAVRNMAKMTKAGGTALVYVPSRNAPFAVLNRLLPEGLKRYILYRIFPESQHVQGFPAYYSNCTASKMTKLFEHSGFKVKETRIYQFSTYFSFCLPLHILWRCYQGILSLISLDNSESFTIIATKKAGNRL